MNLEGLQRRAQMAGLHLRVALKWLIFALEPIGSEDKMEYRAEYKTAMRQLDRARLKEREAQLNRGAL